MTCKGLDAGAAAALFPENYMNRLTRGRRVLRVAYGSSSSATILSAESPSALAGTRCKGKIFRLLAFGSGAVDPMFTDRHFLNDDQGTFPKTTPQICGATLQCPVTNALIHPQAPRLSDPGRLCRHQWHQAWRGNFAWQCARWQWYQSRHLRIVAAIMCARLVRND